MRILDRSKISYEYQTYECDNFTDGISTADTLGLPHERVYKTLVTTGKSGSHYVFVIPIEAELDQITASSAVSAVRTSVWHVKFPAEAAVSVPAFAGTDEYFRSVCKHCFFLFKN